MAKLLNSAWLSLLLVGGCTQIIGLGDYEIDPKLDVTDGGETSGNGGSKNQAGSDEPAGGAPDSAGAPGQGGDTSGSGGTSGRGGTSGGGAAGDVGTAGAGGDPSVPTEIVDCDSAECCEDLGGKAVGEELLGDGGFELGTPDDGSPWLETSTTKGNELMVGDDGYGFLANSGDWYVYLSGIAGETSDVWQIFTIPKTAGWIALSGYRLFQIDAEDSTNKDFCGIGFYDLTVSDPVELPFFWTGSDGDGWGDSPDWVDFEASWDAVPHRGKKRKLMLRGKSDEYPVKVDEEDETLDASSYLFDDVSLKAFHCEVPLK